MDKPLQYIQKKLGFRIKVLMTERDRLRNMESEISSLAEDCEEAIDDLIDAEMALDRAADVLSKQF